MLKMVQIVQNGYLGHISVLTMNTKSFRYQKYGRYLQGSCFCHPNHASELVITDFENVGPNMGQIIPGPLGA